MADKVIVRVEYVNEAGSDLDCVAPLRPCKIFLKDVSDGSVTTLEACVDPTVDVCARDGLIKVLNDAEIHLADYTCA